MLGVSPSIFTAASVACALATNIASSSRLRDMFEERTSTSAMSFVVIVMLMAPLFTPIIGGHVLELAVWRFIFRLLAGYGAICIATRKRAS